ncbi:MAG: GDP-L-fucose synthase [Desulfomonilaceae bacterium]|nr:GDP-L-fucose synthase [Desulfomonilaceae bacterium]
MTAHHRSKPKVFVPGSTGMVGSAIVRRLRRDDYPVETGPVPRVDLCEQASVRRLFREMKPRWVFLAAAKVGGIKANSTYPADFIYRNLAIQTNVLHAAYESGVEKLLFLGSSCIYPKFADQPIKEEYLLTGPLEPTNEPYAVAKIAGIVMAQSYNRQYGTNFLSVMPTNLYGPNDNFDLEDSHVVPALLRKTHEAKTSGKEFVEVWGSGEVRREFLHVDDLADACVFLMENYDSGDIINIGTGIDIAIRDLAMTIKDVVGFTGDIRFNTDMPDGTPRKLLDVSRLTALGWRPSMSFRQGLEATYRWYVENEHRIRK